MNLHAPNTTEISIANARLPQTYENAKTALANCANIDECQDWADKAAALASYARMADDDALMKMATRIQSRAVRRCGELLKQIDGRPGNASKQSADDDTLISQRDIAEQAGMSKRQQVTAVRVANVPAEEFEASVESAAPPTVTALAQQGTKKRPAMPERPMGFQAATNLIGTVERFAQFCLDQDPEIIAAAVMPHEAKQVRDHVGRIDAWLDRFVVNLKD